MLIGEIVTLKELEKMILKAEAEYENRQNTINKDFAKLSEEIQGIRQFMTAEEGRYINPEFKKKYYEIQNSRDEYDENKEILNYFKDKINELASYEDRMRVSGIFVKKEEETYELSPRDLEMFNRYSKDSLKAQDEANKEAEEKKEKKNNAKNKKDEVTNKKEESADKKKEEKKAENKKKGEK